MSPGLGGKSLNAAKFKNNGNNLECGVSYGVFPFHLHPEDMPC